MFDVSGFTARTGSIGAVLKSRSAPKVVEILLVIIIAVILARLFIAFFAPLPLPAGDAVASAPGAAQQGPGIVKSPFPAAAAPALEPVAPPTEDVAETTLDLTLTGVTIWPNAESASASIRTPDGRQKRFAIGDTIVSGVTLAAVYADQAIIDRNGVRESLRFESKVTVNELVDQPQEPIRPHGRRDPAAPPAAVTADSIGRLASVLRVAPGMNANGELVIELYAASDRSAFSALGLEDGDRLVSIDGAPAPADPTALSAMLNQMQRAESVSLVVERNGENVPLRVSLPDLFGD